MKKLIAVLLVALMLTGCSSGPTVCQHTYEEQLTPAEYSKAGEVKTVCTKCGDISKTEVLPAIKSIRILAVGNSFSVDAMEYLWKIFRKAGFEEIVLGNLFIGGCSLNMHCSNMIANSASYVYYKNTTGMWTQKPDTTMEEALAEEPWDVVTLQQASPDSGDPTTYHHLQRLVDGVLGKVTNPNCKLMWHMTWAYQQNSTHPGFATYDKDQMKMYECIVSTVKSEVLTMPEFAGVIPVGIAMQNLRTSPVGDNVTLDGYHLNHSIGRYTAALCWYAYITGLPVMDADLLGALAGNNLDYVRKAVTAAVENPYTITQIS